MDTDPKRQKWGHRHSQKDLETQTERQILGTLTEMQRQKCAERERFKVKNTETEMQRAQVRDPKRTPRKMHKNRNRNWQTVRDRDSETETPRGSEG